MKTYVFAVVPAVVSALWFLVVLVTALLAATVYTGGHPPFAMIPLALNIFGVIAIYPLCLILVLIGSKTFSDNDLQTTRISLQSCALFCIALFLAEIMFRLTGEASLLALTALSLIYPPFFFKDYPSLPAHKQQVIWVLTVVVVGLISLYPFFGRPRGAVLVYFAMLSNLLWLAHRHSRLYETTYHPRSMCLFSLKYILAFILISLPIALFLF